MNFDTKSGYLVKKVLPYIPKCGLEYSKRDVKNLQKLLESIYLDIDNGMKYVNNKINYNCFKSNITAYRDTQKPSIYNSNFFPKYIKKYIEENGKKEIKYSCKILERNINIKFVIFSDAELGNLDKYDNNVKLMYSWLYTCCSYSLKKCNKSLDIYLYPTPYEKKIPKNNTDILDETHINTAMTVSCIENGEIVIWREEEWLKVFFHETFHSFGLDMILNNERLKNKIKNLFPLEINFNLEEAYTETWARIINCAYFSYNTLKDKNNKKDFILYMNMCLEIERLWAASQINKILSFMGLRYQHLYRKNSECTIIRKTMYREKTNVFCYYILSGIFLSNYNEFLTWCYNNNPTYYRLNNSDTTNNKFFALIENLYDKKNIINLLDCVNKLYYSQNEYLKYTSRMSIIEIN
jgi:hypothetical protein